MKSDQQSSEWWYFPLVMYCTYVILLFVLMIQVSEGLGSSPDLISAGLLGFIFTTGVFVSLTLASRSVANLFSSQEDYQLDIPILLAIIDAGKLLRLLLLPLIAIPVAFGELCRELNASFGGFSGTQFLHTGWPFFNQAFLAWQWYSLSWLADSITFNASQVFGWFTTPIEPIAWWSRGLVVIFSFVSDVVLIAAVLNLISAPFRAFKRAALKRQSDG